MERHPLRSTLEVSTSARGSSVTVWGCFSELGKPMLSFCERTMNSVEYKNILESVLQPFMEECYPWGALFQQDNVPCHSCQGTREWFMEEKITVIPCPARSPDFNPKENLCKVMWSNFRWYEGPERSNRPSMGCDTKFYVKNAYTLCSNSPRQSRRGAWCPSGY